MHPTLQAVRQKVELGEALLVDVREKEEWECAHLAGAHHLPLSELESGCFEQLPTGKILFLYCRRANRVKRALPILTNCSANVEILPWGFEDLWAAGFPIA